MTRSFLAMLVGATVICGAQAIPVQAQDSRAFPDDDDPKPANADGKVIEVNPKILRERLGAKEVKWNPETGALTLSYDFKKGQEKDWDVEENCISKPMAIKGIRLAAATKIVHKVVFTEGSCMFQYAIRQIEDKGVLLSAGSVSVRQHIFNDRTFSLNDKELVLDNDSDRITRFAVYLLCQRNRCSLKVNRSEVAFARNSAEPFRLALHGGENGGEFGALTVSGKPDSEWLADFIK